MCQTTDKYLRDVEKKIDWLQSKCCSVGNALVCGSANESNYCSIFFPIMVVIIDYENDIEK